MYRYSCRISTCSAVVIALSLNLIAAADSGATSSVESPSAAYPLLDKLTELPGQYMVLQASSHNKTGHNWDEHWPLYKDANGDDVIFDAAGPGCIRSIWGTHFDEKAVLKFYFDGESEPRYRINEIEFFRGKLKEFPPPLISYERRGEYGDLGYCGNCFVPIPFAKSLKIAIEGESRFFHFLYELYPHGTPVKTFTGQEDNTPLLASFTGLGQDPAGGKELVVKTCAKDESKSGEGVTLFSQEGEAGIIRRIVIEADGSEEFFRNSRISMHWDDHSRDSVNAPTGIFFGCANKASDTAALPLSVETLENGRVRLSCYFPMPFWKKARIVWRNTSRHSLGAISAEVAVSPNTIAPEQGGYFTALYRTGETSYGRDWRLYQSPGCGWFVGVVQSMQNEHYCEGDEHFYIDGAISPQINGTGSEDYYLGCFWPNTVFSTPFACCVDNIGKEGGGYFMGAYRIPSCYGRYHLEAPIPFFSSIDARIQHGGLSTLHSNYRSLAFCYLRRQPAIRQTDFIDVGSKASETAHGYKATHSELTGMVSAYPEGEYFEISHDQQGRRHSEGEIKFTLAIDPSNNGVRIRRLLDQSVSRQMADVFINDQFAGTWYHGYHNEHLHWYESDFDIHPKHTRERDSLEVKLVVNTEDGHGPFTDFYYEVYCFEDDTDHQGSK